MYLKIDKVFIVYIFFLAIIKGLKCYNAKLWVLSFLDKISKSKSYKCKILLGVKPKGYFEINAHFVMKILILLHAEADSHI